MCKTFLSNKENNKSIPWDSFIKTLDRFSFIPTQLGVFQISKHICKLFISRFILSLETSLEPAMPSIYLLYLILLIYVVFPEFESPPNTILKKDSSSYLL